MRTPPSTRTKDDANKELHEIELKINSEKATLEKIQRERASAEAGFVARESKLKPREEACARIEEKFNSSAGNVEVYVENLRRSEKDLSDSVKTLEKKRDKVVQETQLSKEHKTELLLSLDADIGFRKKELESVNKHILTESEKLESMKRELISISDKHAAVSKDIEIAHSSLAKREEVVSKREIESENLRSELRVWAVRLHNKYGSSMNEPEQTLFSRYTL